MNEIGKERKERVDAFTADLEAALTRHRLRLSSYDEELTLYEADTALEIATLERQGSGCYSIRYEREAIDSEGYAAEKDLETVPMPAESPQEYEAWRQRHPGEAELFEQAVQTGVYPTKPSEQFAFTTTAEAQQTYQRYQDVYTGGTRGVTSEDRGFHDVSWTWLAARMGTGPDRIQLRDATVYLGGTPDPREVR